jgi:hypothetical protein
MSPWLYSNVARLSGQSVHCRKEVGFRSRQHEPLGPLFSDFAFRGPRYTAVTCLLHNNYIHTHVKQITSKVCFAPKHIDETRRTTEGKEKAKGS